MTRLSEPLEPEAALFVYGLLKPGEPGYSLVERLVSAKSPGTVKGCLRLRDGLPLLDPAGAGEVSGYLLHFAPSRRAEAWNIIGGFEPGQHYRYALAEVAVSGEHMRANVMLGRRVGRGTAFETADSWSAATDPVFVEGLAEVAELTIETARGGLAAPDEPGFWRCFFRLQSAYLLLWSIVERYTTLRYGPALDPNQRIRRLGAEPAFRAAVVEVGAVGNSVIDSRDPAIRLTVRPDGSKAIDYFYQVRSNLSHRGKSAFRDGQLVFGSIVKLHDVMRAVLADELPALADEWASREPDGWTLLPRVHPG